MALRPFTWLPHNGKRHAIKADLVAYDDTTTLCGEELTVPRVRPTKDQWCQPTCPHCDAAWRAAEGIPVFPRQGRHGPVRNGGVSDAASATSGSC